ncbi:MAG: glycosyltransferase [Candidatus Omnitrophota bacterium]
MTVSIIVAVKGDNPNLRECIESCLRLDYPDFEILVLPDNDLILSYPKTRVIPTGEVTPPIKRDMALSWAKGEILAFLDDDAYPDKDWLTKALRHFESPEIAAVGGPAVTPDSDSLMQKASGGVYCSLLMSGQYVYRYLPKKERFVDDYPSCNFLVRKTAMRELGGFNTKFWPGEDTFLCLRIVQDLKKKIIYDPGVLVYHHRRGLLGGHLKQIANYALHRGYFAKRFPQTSFKFTYFIPSIFLAGLFVGLALTCFYPTFKPIYISAVIFYLIPVFISSISRDFLLIFPVFWGIIFSHLIYGIYFLKGLFSGRLKEE